MEFGKLEWGGGDGGFPRSIIYWWGEGGALEFAECIN